MRANWSKNNFEESGCTFGCFGLVAMVFLIWAWLFGLPTTWGTLNIDIFPPKIDFK